MIPPSLLFFVLLVSNDLECLVIPSLIQTPLSSNQVPHTTAVLPQLLSGPITPSALTTVTFLSVLLQYLQKKIPHENVTSAHHSSVCFDGAKCTAPAVFVCVEGSARYGCSADPLHVALLAQWDLHRVLR